MNEPRSSYASIDGVEISELDLLRYEVKRARIAHFLLYEKIRALDPPGVSAEKLQHASLRKRGADR